MRTEFYLFWLIFSLGFIAKLLSVFLIIIGNGDFLGFIIMILFVAMLHYIYAFLRNPGEMGFYGILYGFLSEFLVSWTFWYALFTLKETKWGTR